MINIQVLHKSGSCLQEWIYDDINELSDSRQINFTRISGDQFDADIIVCRHPINRLISQYYGSWSSHLGDESYKQKIRSQTLKEWILNKSRLLYTKRLYDSIFSLRKVHIVRYEDMMDNPKLFLSFILGNINKLDLLDVLYDKYKDEFAFGNKDLSKDIQNGLVSHRRILDHKEYLHKFTEIEIKFINNILQDVLVKYDSVQSFI